MHLITRTNCEESNPGITYLISDISYARTHAHARTHETHTRVHVPTAGVRAIYIAAGTKHTCAVVTEGRVLCWGFNGNGQLGIRGTQGESNPAVVSLDSGAVCCLRVYTG
jgi:alpha-tubulin suppressor-like RCC1 family protein